MKLEVNDHIWLTRGDFLKHSELTVTVFLRMVRHGQIKKRGTPSFSIYKFEPDYHFAGKTPAKEIIEAGIERDAELSETNKRKVRSWGNLKEENIAWLITFAHERGMTVSEALDRSVTMVRGLQSLNL